MLTEEAHHMFVGETGIGRVVQRTCEAMKAAGIEDANAIDKVRALGVVDLPTIQKKLNLHYTLSLDLFGSEVSTNAANAYNAGLKGRFRETSIEDDHRLENDFYPVLKFVNGEIKLRRRAGADRAQHAAARRLHPRLRQGHRALQQDHRAHRRRLPSGAAACRVPPRHRRVQGRAGDAGRRADRRGDLGQGKGQVAAVGWPTATSSPR